MTEAERQKVRYWRGEMLKAGVSDIRLLPKATKLSEREVALVNATFERQPAGKRQGKLAA